MNEEKIITKFDELIEVLKDIHEGLQSLKYIHKDLQDIEFRLHNLK